MAVFKTVEKLQILQRNKLPIFIGLDDMQVEGVFRWHDDGSVLDTQYKLSVFSPGKCAITQPLTRSSSYDLYQTAQAMCNSFPGFEVETNGHTSACLWWSDTERNFTDARDDCIAKGSTLATFKTLEKYQILKRKRSAFYIGLDDMDSEGVFKWHDDGSVFNLKSTFKNETFRKNEPNNFNDEDCVAQVGGLNDVPCWYMYNYVCEKTCFPQGLTYRVLTMYKVDNPNTALWTSLASLTTYYPTRSITECAVRCLEQNNTCRAISFVSTNRTCSLGECSHHNNEDCIILGTS
ncbi:hypothetical protein Btru_012537 [Bulinus truncatus]|nr:hypothetical protein Btru_012537 [Bulinus truncatus]